MNNRIELLSRSLQKALAETFFKVFPGSQIEISDVLFNKAGKEAQVWLKCDQRTLSAVIQRNNHIQRELARHWQMRYIPSLHFLLDDGYLDSMDELFTKIEDDEN